MSIEKIAVIGSGIVGKTLAAGFADLGYEVMIGTRDPSKLAALAASSRGTLRVGTVAEAAAFGDLAVLAVKGTAAEEAVLLAGPERLRGKTVLDATNPIADSPPEEGVLRFFTTLDASLMERLQRLAPEARFVKAFSCVGSGLMVRPDLPGGPPTMFICGDDGGAKAEARTILERFGWESEDMGPAAAARAIEPLCILWCLPGFRNDDWAHAFKMLRP
jgi:hypothetical protein